MYKLSICVICLSALMQVSLIMADGRVYADDVKLKEVPEDTDEDGRKETLMYYRGNVPEFSKIDRDGDGLYELQTQYLRGQRHIAEIDKDGDGKPETWVYYDSKEKVRRRARDTNGDDKADRWYYLLPDHEMERGQIREVDTNFDGKVDRREFTLFQQNKSTKAFGHLWQWKEQDKDFDGIIDYYRVRGVREPDPDKIGQKMDPGHKQIEEDHAAGGGGSVTVQEMRRVEERERMIRRSQGGLNE